MIIPSIIKKVSNIMNLITHGTWITKNYKIIKVIPHNNQRYNTLGDWIPKSRNRMFIYVSDTGNKNYNNIIALHEFIEGTSCIEKGIKEDDVTDFDIMYEEERLKGLHSIHEEPGDDLRAPYFKEHQTATMIEKIFARELGVNWDYYESTCVEISKTWKNK
jgi:hypothetical protein